MNEYFVPFKAKGGRPRKFVTPAKLLDAFREYLDDRKERVINMSKFDVGSVGESFINKEEKRVKHHPLSIADFCVFVGCSREWWKSLPDEFAEAKSLISDYIFTFQLKGAENGEFNANLVARQLGLADKKEVSASGEGLTIIVNNQEQKEKLDNIGGLSI